MAAELSVAARRAQWMRRLAQVTGEGACRAAVLDATETLRAAERTLANAEAAHVAAQRDRRDRLRQSYDTLSGEQASHDIHALRAAETHLRANEDEARERCIGASSGVDEAAQSYAQAQAALLAAIHKRQRRTEIADRLDADAKRIALIAEEVEVADELMDRAGHTA